MRTTLLVLLISTPAFLFAGELTNGLVPSGEALTLKLFEDLRIHEDMGEEYVWQGRRIPFDVDARGHMYVVDQKGNRIVELNPKGDYVRTIGGPGEGPGEFQALKSFKILADGTALAIETQNLNAVVSYYNADIKFEKRKTHNLDFVLHDPVFSSSGKMITGMISKVKKDHQSDKFVILNDNFKVIHTVRENKLPNVGNDFQNPKFWEEFLPSRIQADAKGHRGLMAFGKNDSLIFADATQYKITNANRKMEVDFVFSKEYEAIPRTEKETMAYSEQLKDRMISSLPSSFAPIFTDNLMKKVIENAEFLPRKHPVYGISVLEDGKILVVHDHNELTKSSRGDLFTSKGKYLGFFTHPNDGLRNILFKGGFAYALETIENEHNLVRYKLEWAPAN